MQLFYKIFLGIFILFIGFNLYRIQWDLGFWNEENSVYILSMSAAVLGIIVLLVLNMMSKLAVKK
ncbi:putative integral membrane protein [Chryseobacterium sp. MP_3.2]|nr:putative integral membrane protein [Chryseobacterium sp. MP_3.2]